MTHLSTEILHSQLEAGYRLVPKQSTWFHYKNPLTRYVVDRLVIIEATEKVGVNYFPADDHEITFIRPLHEWLDEVIVDGLSVPRFTHLDNAEL